MAQLVVTISEPLFAPVRGGSRRRKEKERRAV